MFISYITENKCAQLTLCFFFFFFSYTVTVKTLNISKQLREKS